MGFLAIIAGIFGLDFWVKKKVEKEYKIGEEKEILGGHILLRRYHNKGAILDSFARWPWLVRIFGGVILLIVSIFFISLLREKGQIGMKLALAMILGGGANNFFDRMTKGYVVDYFSFHCKKGKLKNIVFNISDWFIFIGAFIFILVELFGKEHI